MDLVLRKRTVLAVDGARPLLKALLARGLTSLAEASPLGSSLLS